MMLTKKERLFCLYYSRLRNSTEAAARAGYTNPHEASVRLMQKKQILDAIAEHSKENAVTADEIIAGYRRLAFSSCTDVLKLLFCGELPSDGNLDTVDLFNVAEIKKPKDGAMEIKFFDRLKALEHLEELSGALSGSDTALPLYEALMRSAKANSASKEE